ncbi:hypothetical protein [Gloeocapsopsis sp. IPPAS B-1203]|uniref:hypothetical protein n=1 Tax=Gloeocapsopsis sp. IPPAS B-1203 TaxID=2049454 RepID=UPI000C1A5931|nr:hypothetical protein [Gloeocapsopsis sp. IPPAS B-1203]PIG90485.1 hypothetical protein CSQ79_26470 [Gloeocapsopsis sp. IPPAS B-1203]
MPKWISRTIYTLSGTTFRLILLMAGLLMLWGMLAPLSTIVWWLNQTAESLNLAEEEKPDVLRKASITSTSAINCYIVFLPGVGNFSPDQITPGEKYFIYQLAQRHSQCVVVRDVFPYSVFNQDLGSQELLTPLWEASKESDGILRNVLVQVRNLWRFAISADDRYGPIYNLSIAHTIVDRMNAAYPIAQSDRPINLILISTSGGTQVALGATAHLNEWINARLTVVSIGGTFEGRAGFNDAEHVYHLQGDRDWIADLSRVVFPARWSWTVGSPVNQARRQGRYTVCIIGSYEHSGAEGYFGNEISPHGIPYVKQTIEQVDQLPIWSIDQPLISQCPVQKISEK